jgi:peptidoglycan/xylan/chitin deacetylase (PgdA/CDA1 family)
MKWRGVRVWGLLFGLCGVGLVGLVGLPGAGATARPPAPFGVWSASLTQNGQQITWQVRLDHGFTAGTLKRAHRSLCLLVERAGNSGVLCMAPGRHAAVLVYQPVSAHGTGRGRLIAASVSRVGANGLTASFLPAAIGAGYGRLRWQVLATLRSPGCGTTPAARRLGCTARFPGRPALAKLHTPVPVGCVPSGPAFVYNGSPGVHQIALTFDDGPWYDTPQFLDILEREHVHATFFQIGEQESQYGSVDRRILADGDMIGDHTETHADVAGGGSFARNEIAAAAAAIRRASGGFTPCLFRAPGGAFSPSLIAVARSMGFTTIQWDIDPRDWARPGTGAIYGNVIAHAHNGAIVIQHDGGGDRSETLAALPLEIATLRSRGYRFVTVTQLLGQRVVYR